MYSVIYDFIILYQMQNKEIEQFIFYQDDVETDSAFDKATNWDRVSINIKWEKIQAPQIIKRVQQWTSESISLSYNHYPLILKDIEHVKLTNLKWLSVASNQIVSLEGISRMYMPELKRFFFNKNLICCIRDFRKGYFPKLHLFSLNCLKVIDARILDEMDLQNLKNIFFQFVHTDEHSCVNVIWLAKLNTKKMLKLGINGRERIKEKQLERSLKDKYKALKINPVDWNLD